MNLLNILLISSAALLTNCIKNQLQPEREPTSIISLDRSEYTEGDTVFATDHSSDSKSRVWFLPNNLTAHKLQIWYVIPKIESARELTFKLEAYSESRNKSNISSKTVKVNMQKGRVIFYSSNLPANTVIYIETSNGEHKLLTMPVTEKEPACGDQGLPFMSLKEGHYEIRVFMGEKPNGLITYSGRGMLT